MNMTGVKLKAKSSFGSLALKILGFIAQLAERPAVNRKAAGSIPAVPAQKNQRFQWSFVQRQGSCLMRSLCGFDSRSSDHASLAQWKRSCFVISRLSVQIRREALKFSNMSL